MSKRIKSIVLFLQYPGEAAVRSRILPFLQKHPVLTYRLRLLQERWLFGYWDEGTPSCPDMAEMLNENTWPFYSLQ